MASEYMKLFNLTLVIGLFLSVEAKIVAQTTSKLRLEADKFFEKNEYSIALQFYKKALERDSTDVDLIHKAAFCQFKTFCFEEAEIQYRSLFRHDSKKKYRDDQFYYAQTLKMKGDYKKAKREFEKIVKRTSKSDPSKNTKVENEIKGCEMALQRSKSKAIFTAVKRLNENVNSESSELAPLLYHNHFYYSSRVDTFKYSIFVSTFPEYQKKKVIKMSLDNLEDVHVSNLSMNHQKAFFTVTQSTDGEPQTAIYCSDVVSDSLLQKIEKLDGKINEVNTISTQPCFASFDGDECLFYASNKLNGKGGFDLYLSKYVNGNFTNPVALPAVINTEGDEVTPFYCEDCRALYFSSNFHPGLGGFDVFRSNFKQGQFEAPTNVGFHVNSNLNDLYYMMNHSSHKAYFVSNRKVSDDVNSIPCCNDIYELDLPSDSVRIDSLPHVVTVDSIQFVRNFFSTLLPLNLYFDNDEPNPKSRLTKTDADYISTVQSYLLKQKVFEQKYSEGLKDASKEDAELNMQQFFQDSVMGNKLRLDTILHKIKVLLRKNENVQIVVKGYTSSLASNEYNRNLASRRIQCLLNYLSQYDSGFFKTYISSGKFIIKELEIGEDENAEVSDNPNDQKNSVYSLKASYARRIAILKVEMTN